MLREIAIRQVDAFTTSPLAGNAAGVVTRGGEDLSDAQMQAIAREMNVAETAFLLPPTSAAADLRIRWFTPAVEVPLCGHATVASFHSAAEEGSWGLAAEGVHRLRLETLSGVLPIEVTKLQGETTVRMGLPDPMLSDWPDPSRAVAALGVKPEHVADDLDAVVSGFYALLPLRGLDAMRAIRPNVAVIRDLLDAMPGRTPPPDGLIVACLETIDAGSALFVRMFAPGAGVDEDPVTGSAQGPVAGWLARIGYFSEAAGRSTPPRPDSTTLAGVGPGWTPRYRTLGAGRFAYTAEQGDLMNRRGRIDVELTVEPEPVSGEKGSGRGIRKGVGGGSLTSRARDVSIIGKAVTVLKGTLLIP